MINFKLQSFNKITPVGQEPDLYLSWFWLTEGDLWLTFGNQTIYEYSQEALTHFGDKLSPYNDYYLVRFLEDFTGLFEQISENVPEKFYSFTKNLDSFFSDAQKWLDIYDTDEDEYSDFYFEEYENFTSWISKRGLSSIHLVGGPNLWFFKNENKIRVVWDAEATLDDGTHLWTAKSGQYEMNFTDFIEEIEDFGLKFFKEMDRQIEKVNKKNWGTIKVDKNNLIREHKERKAEFQAKLAILKQNSIRKTNWAEIGELHNRMTSELD